MGEKSRERLWGSWVAQRGCKLSAVYSVDDGESPKLGGQKVLELKWCLGQLRTWPQLSRRLVEAGSEWRQVVLYRPWE